MKGLIFSIKRYSIHDGPGIRVTIFMKGCPLKCGWCHNPEGISPEIENVTESRKIGSTQFSESVTAGRFYPVRDILSILEREKIFFQQSGGGVTFSGGEPLFQPEFLLEALRACMELGYHTAVDTSGYCREDHLRSIIPYTNLFLFDIKHLSRPKHIEYTGVSNELILSNFKMLARSGKDIMIRIPVLPGINDDPDHLLTLRQFITDSKVPNIMRINLLPFHRIGASKYKKLGIPYLMDEVQQPSHERMKELKEFFSLTGLKVKTGG